eukprot:TRINITY_DN555_c0_g1_i1.p1 TRINITY_DN555_c0_g1~~TRINITY_DN555_c0_g1_i1.p1  ORF type:complete len:218 (-),score=41.90 TRINITY_DN555_c0_g1_i1:148-801(-)
MGKKALLLIDIQYDFFPGGSLAVPKGDEIVPVVNKIRELYDNRFDLVLLSQDWHPSDHCSFYTNHPDAKPFSVREVHGAQQVMWPPHCIQESEGAKIHHLLTRKDTDIVIKKGTHNDMDSYSAFADNATTPEKRKRTNLHEVLKNASITEVFVCGLATDYCVNYSCQDAADLGFTVYCVMDACRGIDEKTIADALQVFQQKNIKVINSEDLPKYLKD